MPGWHARTKPFEDAGKVRTIGLIQEQHPDRCSLFMQWKQMDFPIMVDPLNLLGVAAVPITVLIDEAGIVRAINPRSPEALEEFANAEAAIVADKKAVVQGWPEHHASGDPVCANLSNDEFKASLLHGVLAGQTDLSGATIAALDEVTRDDDAVGQFHLGVLYRMRYDSQSRHQGDFANAVRHWSQALELNPNQYIWRRRIQQYGPRLDKPYPFYDWVATAREEITTRGEEPVTILVEPSGSEFAQPSREWAASDSTPDNPDPNARVLRDTHGLIDIEPVVVPATTRRGGNVYRVHLLMRPNKDLDAHWNNEVEPTVVWFDPPEGWSVDQRLVPLPMPSGEAVSEELRRIEIEVRADDSQAKNPGETPATIPAYALYYVCEGPDGTCLYLRQDIEITLR